MASRTGVWEVYLFEFVKVVLFGDVFTVGDDHTGHETGGVSTTTGLLAEYGLTLRGTTHCQHLVDGIEN